MSNIMWKVLSHGSIYYATIDDFPIEIVQTNILYPDFLVAENIVLTRRNK